MSTFFRQVWALAAKDLRVELRTKERIASMAAFVILTAVLFNYAMDRTVMNPGDIASGLVWMIIVLGGLLGLGRTFEIEKEEGAMQGLLVAPVPREALFLGKVVSNTVLLGIIVVTTILVIGLFFQVDFGRNLLPLTGVFAVGTIGFVSMGTLFSGITAGTRMGGTLLPVLLFPLLVPLVTFGAASTSTLLAGSSLAQASGTFRLLGAFALIALVSGVLLFRFIVEE